jgi:hypothetical protein
VLIWIASYPRSGNSWFRVVLRACCGQRSESIYPEGGRPPRAVGSPDPATQGAAGDANPRELLWVKTHERPGADSHPAVYLVRDGRDALVSYTWFALQRDKGLTPPFAPDLFRTTMRNLMIGESPFGTWSENVLSWLRRPCTVVVKFEDLIRDPASELTRVVETLGLSEVRVDTTVTPPTFSDLHRKQPLFFRKGESGQWRAEMPADLQALFWKRHGSAMAALGYE